MNSRSMTTLLFSGFLFASTLLPFTLALASLVLLNKFDTPLRFCFLVWASTWIIITFLWLRVLRRLMLVVQWL